MGTKEKLVERFKKQPNDFTFDELERLLSIFGYVKSSKGKTSGSRVIYRNGDKTSYYVAQAPSRKHNKRVCHEASIG